MNIKCRSLFKGNASIGSHKLKEADEKNEDIIIEHDGDKMTVKSWMFFKFFEMGKREYRHKNGQGIYTLKYIKFIPDEVKNENKVNT